MKKSYIAVAVIALTFLLSATWASYNQNTIKLALAPEISATKIERSFGVLGYQDIKKSPLSTVFDMGDYTVTLKDPKIIDLQVCAGSTGQYCNTKINKKALEYTLLFDVSKLNTNDVGINNFVDSRIGKNMISMTDMLGTNFAVQDIGGFPSKTVRFLVDKADQDYAVLYQSQEMKDQGKEALAWAGK